MRLGRSGGGVVAAVCRYASTNKRRMNGSTVVLTFLKVILDSLSKANSELKNNVVEKHPRSFIRVAIGGLYLSVHLLVFQRLRKPTSF